MYELAAMLTDTNTTSEQLHDLIESLYPDTVDADVASQFNVVRRLQAWTNVTILQQRSLACPASLVELRKIYRIMIAVTIAPNASEHSAN